MTGNLKRRAATLIAIWLAMWLMGASAASARFLQADPLGPTDQRNLYAYVANDPLNRTDPTGLAAEKAGNFVASTARDVGRDLADLGRGIARGDVGYVLGGLPPVILPEATIAEETTTLYRAVGPAELQDLQATGGFRTIPGGVEGKYFTTSPNAASSYAQQAVSGFGHPPYTIVQTQVPNSVISDLPLVQVDRGAIPAYVIPSERLPGLQPQILNTSPLPGGR